MRLLTPQLLYTLVFALGMGILFFILSHQINKGRDDSKKSLEKFLSEEHAANFITKKSLPDDIFLQVDLSSLPHISHPECLKQYNQLIALAQFPMVNLQAMGNLTLKKQFGINHLETLCEYEQHYIHFVKALTAYGMLLHEEDFIEESILALEYSVKIGCDLNNCYLYLIRNYGIIKDKKRLEELKRYLKVQPPLGKEVLGIQLDATLQSINNQ